MNQSLTPPSANVSIVYRSREKGPIMNLDPAFRWLLVMAITLVLFVLILEESYKRTAPPEAPVDNRLLYQQFPNRQGKRLPARPVVPHVDDHGSALFEDRSCNVLVLTVLEADVPDCGGFGSTPTTQCVGDATETCAVLFPDTPYECTVHATTDTLIVIFPDLTHFAEPLPPEARPGLGRVLQDMRPYPGYPLGEFNLTTAQRAAVSAVQPSQAPFADAFFVWAQQTNRAELAARLQPHTTPGGWRDNTAAQIQAVYDLLDGAPAWPTEPDRTRQRDLLLCCKIVALAETPVLRAAMARYVNDHGTLKPAERAAAFSKLFVLNRCVFAVTNRVASESAASFGGWPGPPNLDADAKTPWPLEPDRDRGTVLHGLRPAQGGENYRPLAEFDELLEQYSRRER
jgi:hypothetical protein